MRMETRVCGTVPHRGNQAQSHLPPTNTTTQAQSGTIIYSLYTYLASH